MKKIVIFLILLFVIVPTVVNAESINSIDMSIYINNSGDAKVTEVWDATPTEKTEYYHSYKNLGSSTIKNLKVSDENREYEILSSWNPNGSFESKRYKCGLHYIVDGIEVCWGKSDYGRKTYTVEYEITNFVSSLKDAQMAYWTLIPDGHDKFGKVDIEIKSDFAYEDTLDVWGYGNYGGLCYVSDGTIKMSTNGKSLSKNEYMTILVKFLEGTFDTKNEIYRNFEYYLNMAEEGAKQYKEKRINEVLTIILLVVVGISIFLTPTIITRLKNAENKKMGAILICLFGLLLLTISDVIGTYTIIIGVCSFLGAPKSPISKEDKKKVKEAEYYRDIPCEKDLFKAYYIASTYGLIAKKADLLGAIFLKWLKEGRISIIKRNVGMLNKEEECIQFNLADSEVINFISNKNNDIYNTDKSDSTEMLLRKRKAIISNEVYYDFEEKLFKYIVQASKDGILEKNELEKWCKKNYSTILDWFENVILNEENKLEKSGDIKEISSEKIFTTRKKIYGNNVLDEAVKLSGLKKYLKDYTLIHDREAMEVELFEYYLIYAQIFGIAKKVMKEFKDLYPEIVEQSSFESFDNIDLLMFCAYSGISSANYAKTAAEVAASSYSGGGGGFSSGGGRRRLIWWRRPEWVADKR